MNKHKVLVIDDSVVILEVARLALEKAGYKVTTLDNPLIAASEIRRDPPDLVLLDINMPAIRGELVAKVLGAQGLTKKIPVLLHSDIPRGELEELVRRSGASGCISKTDDDAHFVAQVKTFLASPRRPLTSS